MIVEAWCNECNETFNPHPEDGDPPEHYTCMTRNTVITGEWVPGGELKQRME